MPRLEVRRATPADRDVIAAYNAAMAHETEHLTLDAERLRAGVSAVLADPARGFYLVAEQGGLVVGQMMITYEWSDWRNAVFWWIQSVYVHPEHRREGVFKALYSYVEQAARQDPGVCGLRLYVERENQRARAVYARLGMRHAPYEMFELDFVLARMP